MKAEPLKWKKASHYEEDIQQFIYDTEEGRMFCDKDIKSAVEWLKQSIWKFHKDYGSLSTDFTLKEIDKAFEDVVKERR